MTIPGIGPLIATAIEALAPPARDLPLRARLCRLGRADAAAAVDRRQGAPRTNLPHGRAHPAAPADHRGERRRALGQAQGRAGRLLAGRMLARKPPMLVIVALANKMARDRLGAAGQGRNLSSSGRGRVSGRGREAVDGVRRSKDRYGATSVRRDQENQVQDERFERAAVMWT